MCSSLSGLPSCIFFLHFFPIKFSKYFGSRPKPGRTTLIFLYVNNSSLRMSAEAYASARAIPDSHPHIMRSLMLRRLEPAGPLPWPTTIGLMVTPSFCRRFTTDSHTSGLFSGTMRPTHSTTTSSSFTPFEARNDFERRSGLKIFRSQPLPH